MMVKELTVQILLLNILLWRKKSCANSRVRILCLPSLGAARISLSLVGLKLGINLVFHQQYQPILYSFECHYNIRFPVVLAVRNPCAFEFNALGTPYTSEEVA